MQIIIHRGTHEVGGTCIEVEAGSTRIILDVGMPLFDADFEPLDTGNLRRQSREELKELGFLPRVRGLFDDGPRPDAILLSHAHEDHTGLLRHSPPEIPIYASRGTSKMMNAGSRFAGQPFLPGDRHREVTSKVPVQIGEMQVTPFAVDHSIYGSQAFLIEAQGKSLLYSGDLRLHGRKPGMTRDLYAAFADRSLDVLLMEGTHIAHPGVRGPNEYELQDEILDHVKSAPGLVLASFSPQHVDRLVAFLKTAQNTGRVFVADAYTAYVMHLIRSDVKIPPPDKTEWIKVFYPRFFEESFERKRLKEVYFLFSPVRIGLDEVRREPSRYLMLFRPSMLESDFGNNLPQGTRCVYSRWPGYLDRPDWQPVKAALAATGSDLVQAHTSGHIFADDIVEFVRRLKPGTVVPVHTFEPERFSKVVENVRFMDDGEPWNIA